MNGVNQALSQTPFWLDMAADDQADEINKILQLFRSRLSWSFPFSEAANTTPRERASDEQIAEALARLRAGWRDIVGDELARVCRPVAFSGRKQRRLVVAADYSATPPWGSWTVLPPGTERLTFTRLRKSINDCIAPLAVDHVDFIDRADIAHTGDDPV